MPKGETPDLRVQEALDRKASEDVRERGLDRTKEIAEQGPKTPESRGRELREGAIEAAKGGWNRLTGAARDTVKSFMTGSVRLMDRMIGRGAMKAEDGVDMLNSAAQETLNQAGWIKREGAKEGKALFEMGVGAVNKLADSILGKASDARRSFDSNVDVMNEAAQDILDAGGWAKKKAKDAATGLVRSLNLAAETALKWGGEVKQGVTQEIPAMVVGWKDAKVDAANQNLTEGAAALEHELNAGYESAMERARAAKESLKDRVRGAMDSFRNWVNGDRIDRMGDEVAQLRSENQELRAMMQQLIDAQQVR